MQKNNVLTVLWSVDLPGISVLWLIYQEPNIYPETAVNSVECVLYTGALLTHRNRFSQMWRMHQGCGRAQASNNFGSGSNLNELVH